MKRISLLFAFALLTGCATTAKYERVLNSWIGLTEVDLVRKWGPPQQAYDAGNSRFLKYSDSSSMYIPGQAPTYTTTAYGNTAYTTPSGGYAAQNIDLSCETTFELVDGVIKTWTWRGNNCISK